MASKDKNGGAVVIPLKRGKLGGSRESLADKVAVVRSRPARERCAMILADAEGRELARSLTPQELYWLVKEVGGDEGHALVALSSPEQCRFFLDMELWREWTVSQDKVMEWLEVLLDAGDERLQEQLPSLDFELLLLVCKKEVLVGGGIGDMVSDDERAVPWDHTFDNMFYFTFRDEAHAPLVGRFLDSIYRLDHDLYLRLMECTKSEVESELEELSYRFRSGRLADWGFPEREDALALYAYLDPGTFTAEFNKVRESNGDGAQLPVPTLDGYGLLQRAMARAADESLVLEFNYVLNTALVADEIPLADQESLDGVLARVCGYLNIALEWLCGTDEDLAVRLLQEEYLRRLFQLGFSILVLLRRRADVLHPEAADHATNRALLGLRRKCPRYYRGLDPDCVDGYREFRQLADVRAVDSLLRELGG